MAAFGWTEGLGQELGDRIEQFSRLTYFVEATAEQFAMGAGNRQNTIITEYNTTVNAIKSLFSEQIHPRCRTSSDPMG